MTEETGDQYIGAEVSLPKNGQLHTGKVIRRQCNDCGDLIGKANQNRLLDTRSYQVQFPDGEIAPYAVNLIAENMITQCDPDSNQFLLLESITDHKKDKSAVPFGNTTASQPKGGNFVSLRATGPALGNGCLT